MSVLHERVLFALFKTAVLELEMPEKVEITGFISQE